MFDTESADRPPLFQDAAAVTDGDFNREEVEVTEFRL